MGTICVPGALGGQKRVLDALELELPVVGSHHVGVGNCTWILKESRQCSQSLSHL